MNSAPRTRAICTAVFASLVAASLALPGPAEARFIIGFDDMSVGAPGTFEAIIIDNVDGIVSDPTPIGAATDMDGAAAGGAIQSTGLTVTAGGFTITGLLATSGPTGISVVLPMVSGSGTLNIIATENTTSNPGLTGIVSGVSATLGATALMPPTVQLMGTRDEGDGEFATGGGPILTADVVPALIGPGPVAGSSKNSAGSIGPYSLTADAQLVHPSSAVSFGVTLQVAPVPEPSALLLTAFGAVGLLGVTRRRKR